MVDMDRMRKAHEQTQKGGDFLQFENGETLVYIHPECRSDDEYEPTTGLNFISVGVHYGVGKNKGMAVSLDPEKNPIITHPFIKQLLKKKKVRLTGKCPMGAALESGELSDEEADDSRLQTRFLWGMTPLKHRPNSKSTTPWTDLSQKPSVAFVGKQIFDGIMEAHYDHGQIHDPDGAVLVRICKEGKDRNVKYKVKVEPFSLKKAFVLNTAMRKALNAAMVEGGDCDLFRIVSNFTKGPAEVQAMLAGVKVSDEPDDDDDDEDEEETPKTSKGKGKKPPPDEDEEDEEDEDEPPPKPKGKKAPPPDDEEDEEEDDEPPPKAKKPKKTVDEDEEEDEDEPPPKKGKKAPPPDDEEDDEDEEPPPKPKSKKAPPPADDEDEEDDEPKKPVKGKKAPPPDDDEDEDEPPPKPKKADKAKPKKPADDDEDEDLDVEDLEQALEDIEDDEDEEDDEPPKPKKSKK